jgi:sulfatase modifying factor 1
MKIPHRNFLILFLMMVFALVFSACQTSAPKASENVNVPDGMVFIKGGSFQMGDDEGMPFESPAHTVKVDSFLIDEHEVTVAEFAKFVEATGYKTEAEKYGWSGVFDFDAGEWRRVDGADWRHPEGKNSVVKDNEPVCQISWNDATEYAKWAGKRLPSEAEFEYAARGGLAGKKYAWGDELKPNGKFLANWWQGSFPDKNTVEDGFLSRAPVKSFAPNGYGLYDMTGNVWEWTSDWFDENYYSVSPQKNPKGASSGTEKSIRGGSFLCAENFCSNYRVAGRSRSAPDSGLNNLGFRCARDVK